MLGFERWMEQARAMGLDVRLQSSTQVYGRYPGATVQWVGGLYTESDAMAEPWVAVPLLAAGAVQRGAVIVEGCAVRRLDRAGGRVVGVHTEQGRIACDQVVVAGGAWSSLFLAAEGVRLPQLSVLASVLQTEPMAQVTGGCLADDRMGVRRRADGGYSLAPGSSHNFFIGPDAFRRLRHFLPKLKTEFRKTRFRPAAPPDYPDAWRTARSWSPDQQSPFERQRILNPAPDMKALTKVLDHFTAAFPDLGRPVIRSAWAGMIDTMPDVVPVVDHVATIPGLTIATGMCGHGFGIGPGIGRVVADLVAGNPTGHDLTRFRLARFTDGSPLQPAIAL
jgi:glycine/D-amino acid oxidase-like deaminating enzyme